MSPQNSPFSPFEFELDGDGAGRMAGRRLDLEMLVELGRAFDHLGQASLDHRQHRVAERTGIDRPGLGIVVELQVVVVVGAAEHVLGVLEGRHPFAVLEPGVPADMIDMQVGAHHHVDLVGLDAGCLQPLEILGLHQMPFGPMRARLVVADAGIDQDALAPHGQKPAMDAELQRIRGFLVVVGYQPVAVLLHHLGRPVGEEHLGIEVGLVGFLDAPHRGSAQPHFGHVFLPPPASLGRRAGLGKAGVSSVKTAGRPLSPPAAGRSVSQ